jgi:hypothetical protein
MLLPRELQRVGGINVSLYIDGRRGIVRLRFPEHAGEFSVSADSALKSLRSGAGLEATVNTMAQT